MKQLQQTCNSILLIICLFITSIGVSAQDSVKAGPVVKLNYFVNDNSVPYLMVQSQTKTGKKFNPLPGQAVKIFLDNNNPENLIIKTNTDKNGKAKVAMPATLKDKWSAGPKHNFIAEMEAPSPADPLTATIEITKAKIAIDTSNTDGIRTVNVKVMFLENNDWVPAKDVEMKIGINRLGGILSAGEEETYTTDSSGIASAEFKRDSLPGDEKGNIVLVAKVEDNDLFGNLLIEKTVHWGAATMPQKNFFDQRTLWSTRFKTPLWLLFMAYSIVISVWGTIIYLVWQIVRIKKLGLRAN